ncbi:pseudaminic acid synthase [Shouchella patagoniensis]|uniref:pseudaminic acid synthase n=1 Tax=Shouchella patagoniensis TaxID=228576 RepID=UPI000995D179|nr:pseudaminic acid synthase [Shouchella patagoniensis]
MSGVVIEGRRIGEGNKPFIIAKTSDIHQQSLGRAIALVDAAADAGAHAFSIQTYKPGAMTLNLKRDEFMVENENERSGGKSLYELYEEVQIPWEWHEQIFDRCRKRRMIPFSTPYDEESTDFLDSLGVGCFKIASLENTNLPLLRYVAQKGKPLIVSTGMATLAELDQLVSTVQEEGCKQLILLKSTSSYPANAAGAHLRTIPHMKHAFNCEGGLSDRTIGVGTAIASIALGASVIEKLFTLNRTDADSAFSLEPQEFKHLVEESERAWRSLGRVSYGPTLSEVSSLQYRRSLYISEDVQAGDELTRKNLRVIRPGLGLEPKYYEQIIGRKIKQDAKKGTPFSWKLLLN